MLDAPRLRTRAEMEPPDDEEETAADWEARYAEWCDHELDRRRERENENGDVK